MTKYYGHIEDNNLVGVFELQDEDQPDPHLVHLPNWTGWTKKPSPYHVMRLMDGTAVWIDSRSQAEKTEQNKKEIKLKRDQLLNESDWVIIKALDTGIPVPTNWQVYRQQLRDITTQSGYPMEVTWPIKPV